MKKLLFLILVSLFMPDHGSELQAQPKFKEGFNQNKAIAHRGAWKNTGAPQNSIASLKAAIELGVAGSEFDIWLTADSILVINHDADHNGMIIEKTRYADLLKHPLKNGEPIPTLEQYISAGMKQRQTLLIAELKPSKVSKERGLLAADILMETISRLGAEPWMVYISFDYDILKRIVQRDKTALTMYLNGDAEADRLKADGIYGANYQYRFFQQHEEWIAGAHRLGLAISSWTVNDPEIMDALLAKNIDFITTDEPELLFQRIAAGR